MVMPNATLFNMKPAEPLTPAQAKKLIASQLADKGITVARLSAKTVGFSDLARAECVFVTVTGYPFDGENGNNTNYWHNVLKPFAVANGFRVTT